MSYDVETVKGFGPSVPAVDEEDVGGIVWSPASQYVKELRKWEQFPSEWTVKSRPGNPYVFREYPKMLYKVQRQPNQQFACMMPMPDPYSYDRQDQYQQAILMAESFNRTCQKIVGNEGEERIAKGQGWALSASAAMELHEKEQRAIGDLAAEAAFNARRMNEQAREEYKDAEATTHQHVTDVAGPKRGRPKAVTAVEEE